MPLLQDKIILITGSTSGIGAATARRCVAEGARVMLHGRLETDGADVREELGDAAGFVAADLVDPDAPRRIAEATLAKYGRLDGLVNCAAVMTRCNLDNSTPELFEKMVGINLRAPLFMCQAVLPQFRKQGRGVVLNIGSINAYCGQHDLLIYSIAKGGMMTMTRNLADSHKHEHIRFNQINVGWTLTENERKVQLAQGQTEGWEKRLPPELAPSGRLFAPEEIAAHAAFWLSDEAGPVSGSIFEVEQFPMVGRNPHKGD